MVNLKNCQYLHDMCVVQYTSSTITMYVNVNMNINVNDVCAVYRIYNHNVKVNIDVNDVQYIASTITMLPGFTFGALLAYSAMALPQVAIIVIIIVIITKIIMIIITIGDDIDLDKIMPV